MIVRKHLQLSKILAHLGRTLLGLFALSLGVVVLHRVLHVEAVAVASAPMTALGTALAILLGFRTNNAYDRWWEGRRLWGEVVNRSRSLARQIISLSHPGPDGDATLLASTRRELVYRQIAYACALKQHLRRLDPFEELGPLLPAAELEALRTAKNVPNALLLNQARALQAAREAGLTEEFPVMQMDAQLSALTDAQGGCERIKHTVFPRQYSYYTAAFTWLFLIVLPFTLVAELGWLTPFAVAATGFIFIALVRLGNSIENPFENTYNDTPMSAICRNIEINLREMLGETELPPPLEPVDGFLH